MIAYHVMLSSTFADLAQINHDAVSNLLGMPKHNLYVPSLARSMAANHRRHPNLSRLKSKLEATDWSISGGEYAGGKEGVGASRAKAAKSAEDGKGTPKKSRKRKATADVGEERGKPANGRKKAAKSTENDESEHDAAVKDEADL